MNMKTPELVRRFWQFAIDRGNKPCQVYAVVHTQGSTQPSGYVQTWTVNKRAAVRLQDRCGGLTEIVVLTHQEAVT